MRFSTFFALASTVTLVSAATPGLYCDFAADNSGMIQKPYCCDKYEPHEHRKETLVGKGCDLLERAESCKGGYKPTCCYTIDEAFICTTDAKLDTDE